MNKLISVCDVREIYNTATSDSIVSAYIDAVQEKIGKCVDDSYTKTMARIIKSNMVAHLLSKSEGARTVSSTRAPNGASVTYESTEGSDGIMSTQYGRAVYDLDTEGCWTAMVAEKAFVFTYDDGVASDYSY